MMKEQTIHAAYGEWITSCFVGRRWSIISADQRLVLGVSMNRVDVTRPLFEEPSEASERSDPWSGPKGFMIGGMSLPTKFDLGQEYFDAANTLIEAIRRNEIEDYRVANPVLFLYRHSLEMTLKGMIGIGARGHDLSALADMLEVKYQGDMPKWVTARLKEIAAIDPNSTAFRYAENRDKQSKRDVRVDGEIYVSLNHIQALMNVLNSKLLSISGASMFRESR